jgi:hypothetical protein
MGMPVGTDSAWRDIWCVSGMERKREGERGDI